MKNSQEQIEVHEQEPEGFTPQVHVAACFLENEKRLLLLQRAPTKLEPCKWGLPAGKVELNETIESAARRELFEETSIEIPACSPIHFFKSLYIRKPTVDYVFHLFIVPIDHFPEVKLSDEHQDFLWASQEEIETLPLMGGAAQAFYFYRSR